MHISDRRLTWPDGRVAEDQANKAVVFNNQAVFSYTGISRVGSLRTDEWIAQQLIGKSGLQDAISSLTSALDVTVAKLPYPNRQLGIIVDCWASTQEEPDIQAWSCAISNFIDPIERKVVAHALPTFSTFTQKLQGGQGYAFLPFGQQMAPTIMKNLIRHVVRAMRHAAPVPTTIAPESVARFMRDAVLAVAAGNGLVGRNLMMATLLNRSLPENYGKSDTFGYYPDGASDPTIYAPIIITPSLAIKGFKMYPGPPRFKIKSNVQEG